MKELSLRPYNGRLFIVFSTAEYEKAHLKLFKTIDVLSSIGDNGKLAGGEGKDGFWTYLLYAKNAAALAHELSHVVLHVFERCGIDPREANGEPFCYMLGQLFLEAKGSKK